MTLRELEKLVADGEGETVEFKETTGQRGDACRTLCAFLNGKGGTVVFGVSRKGVLQGQAVSDATKRDLFEVFDRFEPAADIATEWVRVDTIRQAIVCRVERGNMRPYLHDGKPYRRVQSSTTVMSQEEYERMLSERGGFRSDWDMQPAQHLSMEDLDLDEVAKTARMAIAAGRLASNADTTNPYTLLRKFRVMRDGRLLNAAAVLFGTPDMFYPQCQIKMARFKGSGRNEFGDERRESGNVFALMDAAMQFCFKHLNLSGKVEGFLREERLELPPEALREAILNALAHRQYSRTATVSLAIYDDRVEITSPGGLPPGKTVGTLMEEHESEPRNTLVAQVMYLRKAIEMWGRGFSLMATECARYAVPAPLVAETPDGFVKVTFQRPASGTPVGPEVGTTGWKVGTTPPEVGTRGGKVGTTPPEVDTTGGKAGTTPHEPDPLFSKIQWTLDTCSPVLRKNARHNAELVLLEIARDPVVTIKEIAGKTSLSRTTVNNIQTLLRNFGILYRIGGHFGGRWLVVWKGTSKTP